MIELISTITTKNRGSYAIALSNEIKGGLHSVGTAKDRDAISTARLQEGMLCWVVDEELYYQWINNEWIEFTVGGEGNSYIYRVTTYEDMIHLKDNEENIVDFGTLCHVVNDNYRKYLYYYGKNDVTGLDGWIAFKADTLVHIGTTSPNEIYPSHMLKKILWVDTRNYILDDEDFKVPTFIDSELVDYLKNQSIELRRQMEELQEKMEAMEEMIQGGDFGEVDSNTYMTTEDGDVFITEDGDKFITEDSKNTNDSDTYIISEDGNTFITENGDKFILEDK